MSDSKLLEQKEGSLAGHLLVATAVVQDSCFARSVVYLCSHNESGAMGIIINYPVENIHLEEIFRQLDINMSESVRNMPVHFGGPVECNRGFVVHGADYPAEDSLIQKNGVAVTASINVLQALAEGKGPAQGMLVLGYSGWSPGQLENEIEGGSWIVVPATKKLVLEVDNETKWDAATATLGFDMGHYSTDVGHA